MHCYSIITPAGRSVSRSVDTDQSVWWLRLLVLVPVSLSHRPEKVHSDWLMRKIAKVFVESWLEINRPDCDIERGAKSEWLVGSHNF